jgi:hypothetical protein
MSAAAGTRGWTLFLVAWAATALLTRTAPAVDHEWSRLGTIDSIVERGTFELETSRFHGTGDKIFYNGHYYSHQPPLLPLLEAPVYWVLRRFDLRFWNSAPFDLAYYLFTLFTNGLAFALTVVLFDRLLSLAGMVSRWRAVYALLLPAGTWLLPYALVTNNHGISALLTASIAYLLLSISMYGGTTRRALMLGTSLGLITAIEVVPLVSFVPFASLFVVSRAEMRRPLPLALFAMGLLVPLIAHAALNVPLTGDLRPGGFHAELFDYQGSRFTSETLTGQFNHDSIGEFADYSWRALVSERSYFTFAPVLLIGLVAGLFGQRRWGLNGGAYLVLLWGSVYSLVATLLMTNNLGGAAVGFRHAVFICPSLLALLLPILGELAPPKRGEGEPRGTLRVARTMVGVVAALSAVALLMLAVPRPWSQLRLLAPETPPTTWRNYVPVIAYAIDRLNGKVDEFGNPSTRLR